MSKPTGHEAVKSMGSYIALPADGYVCEIKDAKVDSFVSRNGNEVTQLKIFIDIAEGEYKGYYADDYKTQQSEDKKWRGVLNMYYGLKKDGSKNDEWTKQGIKGLWEAIESSNTGFVVNVNEDWEITNLAEFKGKKVGIVFKKEEWIHNDKVYDAAKANYPTSVDKIKLGDFKIPEPKLVQQNVGNNSGYESVPETEDLPF